MKIGIMQPYFFPYIGYFQLMNAVDEFVVYDKIQFTKKGWINRNRILVNNKDAFFTLPLRKDSDYLNVVDRYLADIWPKERKKMLNRIIESYRKAPYFNEAFPLLEECYMHDDTNLFRFIFHSLQKIRLFLNIETELTISSSIQINHELKAEEKVISICNAKKASTYINPEGGINLYKAEDFQSHGLKLLFLKANPITYEQFNGTFIPWLSIIDVIMFNSKKQIDSMLNKCSFFG